MALRGKLSKLRMEYLLDISLDNCVLADPGVLVSKIYPQIMNKKYKVGIIPHYIDKTVLDLNKINVNNFTIIDIQQDVNDVVKQICECECILSSSLHGLIFSDSYNIPNRQIILSDKITGGCYKFEDYYSAYGLKLPKPIDLRNNVVNQSLINDVINLFSVKDIETKQNKLAEVFKDLKNMSKTY